MLILLLAEYKQEVYWQTICQQGLPPLKKKGSSPEELNSRSLATLAQLGSVSCCFNMIFK